MSKAFRWLLERSNFVDEDT